MQQPITILLHVGSELVISKAREMGAASIGLTVHKINTGARALYEKMNLKYEEIDYLNMILKL